MRASTQVTSTPSRPPIVELGLSRRVGNVLLERRDEQLAAAASLRGFREQQARTGDGASA
jgi:hypothetical protein